VLIWNRSIKLWSKSLPSSIGYDVLVTTVVLFTFTDPLRFCLQGQSLTYERVVCVVKCKPQTVAAPGKQNQSNPSGIVLTSIA